MENIRNTKYEIRNTKMINFNDTFKLATRMFRTRPMRTWLTILGIGVGISAVVILVGLGYGLQRILLEKIVFGEAMLSLDVVAPPSQVITIDDQKLAEFQQIANVQDVSPLASFSSSLTFNGLTGSIILNGVNPSYFRYAGIAADKGSLFAEGENDQIVISSALLKLFDVKPEQIIGQYVDLKVLLPSNDSQVHETPLNKQYRIKGVVADDTSLYAFIPLGDLTSQFAITSYERARVKISSREFLDKAANDFLAKGLIVNSLSKTVDQANKIFNVIQIVLAIFGGIALIVSAIGMFNTMTVTLLERTKEIGIMRTIGASNLTIEILFLSEAILMGFFGGLSGVAIGVGGGTAINLILGVVASRMGGQAVNLFEFPLWFLGFMVVFSAILGALTGFFPSRNASKLNPLDAIRYS
ncbi:MAG: ABC transporter permease [Patescibacteria group bacterium]|nr:ABC transporter permease [Patescibacteria group bacterium]